MKEIYSLCFDLKSDYILSGSADDNCILFNVQNGKCEEILEGNEGEIISAIFNYNSNDILISNVDNFIKLYTNIIII